MISRREALLGMGLAALTSAAPSAVALGDVLGAGILPVQDPATDAQSQHTEDERLRTDLAGMANRADSEEGVPVLLACVNLVKDKSSGKVPPVKLSAMNKAVAADFRATAGAWQRIKPKAEEGDAGNLIQVLAVRDFANVGKGGKS